MVEEFPQDFFVKIDSDEYRVGCLSLNLISGKFAVEINIVQKESKKIWQHVDMIFNFEDKDEALEVAVQNLSNFLKGK